MTCVIKRRSGFTLLELLVVISLIALLLALTAGAVFRLQADSREKNTNIEVRKLQMGFDQQYKAAIDRIKSENIPSGIVALTTKPNGQADPVRARALHMKLRLRQEFPQTFVEADSAKFQVAYPTVWANFPEYRPKQLFNLAVSGATVDTPNNESAALLVLILGQGRGGAEFNVEGVTPARAGPVGGKQLRLNYDHFDNPIAFRRWADAGDDPANSFVVAELSLPPLGANGLKPDNQDPDGRLSSINDWAPANRLAAINLFVSFDQRWQYPLFNQSINPLDGLNRGPIVFSSGKDKTYMTDDDVFGFRIQGSGKGN